jgi:hypothetical protein
MRFSCLCSVQSGSGGPQCLRITGLGPLSPGVELLECEAGQSPPSRATLACVFIVWCVTKHRSNYYLFFSFFHLGCLSPFFSVHKCCILSEVHTAWRPAVISEIFMVFLSASRYVLGQYFKLVLDHFLSNLLVRDNPITLLSIA